MFSPLTKRWSISNVLLIIVIFYSVGVNSNPSSFGNDEKKDQLTIIKKPLSFPIKRKLLSLQYIRQHYDPNANSIFINPKMIVIHWTGSNNIERTFKYLDSPTLPHSREDIKSASELNVSSHFLIDRNGTIFQLMPEIWMARHTIGLNRSAIGIENIGSSTQPLTEKQLVANSLLVDYLVYKFPGVKYLIGHYQYLNFYDSPYWEEMDENYYSIKTDPGKDFMQKLNKNVKYLLLLDKYIPQ